MQTATKMKPSRILLITLAFASIIFSANEAKGQVFILTNDQQLRDLANSPEKEIDNTTGINKSKLSLKQAVEQAKGWHSDQITIAFDEFFRQYRDDRNTERKLTPDMDEYVDCIAKISDYTTKNAGAGLQLSLLSPLELGQAYRNQTGNTGKWVAFKVGMRNAQTGKFSLQMWQQTLWTNNKGATPVKLCAVRAYAFKGKQVGKTKIAVNPDDIKELKNVNHEVLAAIGRESGTIPQRRLRIFGEEAGLEGYDNVLVLLEYETQEIDYFADDALPFLKNLLKKYRAAGVNLRSLYCDEMHIQQDWDYFAHQEDGQFNLRFYTEGMGRMMSRKTGMPFDIRHMLYFVNQPLIYKPTVEAIVNVEYVLGGKPVDVQRTYLMRDSYYRLLNDHVVDLFVEAKQYGEKLFNREFRTGAHSSWAESPTIDKWETPDNTYAANYEYTPNFLWSNTVHQASAACYDYFKWGEYLQPTGNDFCECGWLDRNYYGAAMAASIGVVNKIPNAYAAAWGMPAESNERRMAINYAYGCDPPENIRLITNGVHRDIDVLMLYPMNLVAVDPRFGSWMTQYGYANYITSDMMLRMGEITPEGKIRVAEKEYGTLAVLYEPLPEQGELDFMEKFLNAGGKVLWMSAPPMLDKGGKDCSAQWQRIFGAKCKFGTDNGKAASGKRIEFTGLMKGIEPQTILTDFIVDRIYPAETAGSEVAATCNGETIGTVKNYPNGGRACFMGCRLRDDQSRSLGYESRNMFEVLNSLGAYPASGAFKGVNDNPAYLSRTGGYFVSSFPNGTAMVVNHYRTHVENWDGNFSRNGEYDARILKDNPLPGDTITLKNAAVNGHRVSYTGRLSMGFNVKGKRLCAFYGQQCNEITVDGRKYKFAATKLNDITFGPVKGDMSHYNLYANGAEEITIPVPAAAKSAKATVDGAEVPANVKKGSLTVKLKKEQYGRKVDIRLWHTAKFETNIML